jgi:hypothetical protein
MKWTGKRTYIQTSPQAHSFDHLQWFSFSLYQVLSFVYWGCIQYKQINLNLGSLSNSVKALLETMKLIICLINILVGTVFAFPGMNNLMRELAKRQAAGAPAPEMIGDLVQGATTPVGNQVKSCLLGSGPCQDLTPKVGLVLENLPEIQLTIL